MPKVLFEDQTGVVRAIDAAVGDTVMNTAVKNGVLGIVGECGGSLSCATCHVYVDKEWIDTTGRAQDLDDGSEDEMLDTTASERLLTSRLSCQISVTAELDGLRVRVPDEQQ
jgi:2Fe-2S ferredoxin